MGDVEATGLDPLAPYGKVVAVQLVVGDGGYPLPAFVFPKLEQ